MRARMYLCNSTRRMITINSAFFLLLICTMFLSFQIFISEELSKWYVFIVGGMLFYFLPILAMRSVKIDVDFVIIFIVALVGYILVSELSSQSIHSNIYCLSFAAFILLFLSFRIIPPDYIGNADTIILSVCIIQASYGLMQYFGISHTYKVFNIVGSFDNPAGFATCLSAGFPFCFSALDGDKWKRYLGIIALVIITLSIILSGSRASIMSMLVVSIIFLVNRYHPCFNHYRKYLFGTYIVILVIGAVLFFLKRDSAIGRILIWINSFEMILDYPILGSNSGSFLRNYMLYQADYFKLNPNSQYIMLADNVKHPFNEYLLLTIKYGILGLLALIVVAFSVIKSSNKVNIYQLCLLSIGIVSFFSYPLRYPFVVIMIAYCLANIKYKRFFMIKIKITTNVIVAIFIGGMFLILVRDVQFEKHWGQVVQISKFGNYNKLLDEYKTLYSKWNGNPMFLYNYGVILNKSEHYNESNNILFECTKYFNDYEVQMLIADNYSKLEKRDSAEAFYRSAYNMIPNRFIPLSKLFHLYIENNNYVEATKIARIITNKEIKIQSMTISQIVDEAESYLQHN
ncbi:MAG TPA: hypothetical protein DHV06_04865 [Bacteroides thetaiotaomicron]|uniref:O-antigen ligase family protein n=1 Tax=Bacteroides thetaiotaomicron TaxID=818 RepID=UPI000EDDB48E|nr:hypothetical protein [Bacteroides thetaiotaomicron]